MKLFYIMLESGSWSLEADSWPADERKGFIGALALIYLVRPDIAKPRSTGIKPESLKTQFRGMVGLLTNENKLEGKK